LYWPKFHWSAVSQVTTTVSLNAAQDSDESAQESTYSMATEPPTTDKLQVDLHVKYIQSLNTKKDDLEYWLTEHLRLQGIYWGITALDLMQHVDALPREEVIKYVCDCQHESGGFGGHIGHDPHIQNTLPAIQVLATLNALDAIDADKVVECKN
jgi:geranylgeranyl transferase type-2 subunit beta